MRKEFAEHKRNIRMVVIPTDLANTCASHFAMQSFADPNAHDTQKGKISLTSSQDVSHILSRVCQCSPSFMLETKFDFAMLWRYTSRS